MEIDELKRKFILDEKEVRTRLEELISKALKHCRVDSKGRVHFENKKLSGKDKIKLVLAARGLASELEPDLSADVTVAELSQSTGLPDNQVSARCKEFVAENYAESPKRGVFRALFTKIEPFLDSIKENS